MVAYEEADYHGGMPDQHYDSTSADAYEPDEVAAVPIDPKQEEAEEK